MKKQIITIVLFTLVAMIGQAKQPVVWEKPTAFIGKSGVEFEITKVELKETETVMHITVNFIPNYWIRFAKTSFLQTPAHPTNPVGKMYGCYPKTVDKRYMKKGMSLTPFTCARKHLIFEFSDSAEAFV